MGEAGEALQLHPTELSALQATYLACLAESVATKQPHTGLAIFFGRDIASGQVGRGGSGQVGSGRGRWEGEGHD